MDLKNLFENITMHVIFPWLETNSYGGTVLPSYRSNEATHVCGDDTTTSGDTVMTSGGDDTATGGDVIKTENMATGGDVIKTEDGNNSSNDEVGEHFKCS